MTRGSSSVPPTMTQELSQEVREIQKTIDLSFQVEAFLKSPIGQYLVARSDEEVEAAVEELKKADPEKAAEVRAIQNRIHVIEQVQYWLAEAIQAGHNAAEQFMNKEQ